MIKNILLILSIGIVTSCASQAKLNNTDAFAISNLLVGDVCFKNGSPAAGKICKPTNTVIVSGESKCVYANETIPCKWHGYEFDYDNPNGYKTMSCRFDSNQPYSSGNPKEIRTEDAYTDTIDFPMKRGQHRFYNPQYTALVYAQAGQNTSIETTTCFVNGQEIFQFETKVIYPIKE